MLLRTALASLVALPLFAQPLDAPGRLRALNKQALELHAAAKRATPAQAALIHSQAFTVLQQRSDALKALIREAPAAAVGLAFSADVLAELAATFPQSAMWLEQQGAWEGPVEYLIFDDEPMSAHRSSIRVQTGMEWLEVHFAKHEPQGLKCGDRMRVQGVRAGTVVAAADGSVTSTASTVTCTPAGEQKVAVLLVTFPGVSPPSLTPQAVSEVFFAASGRSVDGFWREASYGKAWATGQVFGWYTLDAVYTCDQYYQMRDAAIRAADADVDFRQYNRIFIVFPPQGGCGWAGLSTVGCSTQSSPGDGVFTSSVAWLVAGYMGNRDQGVKLAAHEGGHGLGLGHASSRDFGAEALGALGTAGTLSEYGDVFSTMGSWNLGHYNAPHKLRLNWLASGTNIATVESSGSFSIQPIEVSPPGLQALKVRRGTGNNAWLWVEYRQPQGLYDSTLSSQPFSGALIHYEDSTTTGSKTHLLDFTPETSSWTDPALVSGKSWVDPYSNVSLYVEPAAGGMLNLAVNYGAAPCVTAAPTVSLAPANPGVQAGGTVQYTVTVTNNDSAGCAPATFALSTLLPGAWVSTFSQSALTLSPGQTLSATMSKSVPASTAPGTYAVDATAANGARSATGGANCSVLAPPPPLTATLSVPPGPYSARSTVTITADVLSGASPAAGASVRFNLLKPNGATESKTATTDKNGKAVWTFRPGKNDPKGTYSVTITAIYGAQSAAAGPAMFAIN